jgi:putative ABC transport system ATP-binding protein
MPALETHNLTKSFPSPDGGTVRVVDVPEFRLENGAQVALEGESGCGKTTFLNLVAGILVPDSGTVTVAGVEMTALSEAARDRARACRVGYVFQSFNLLQGCTALENVALGMSFGAGAEAARARALLDRVGLARRMDYLPRQLSTGQQQRVAVARALANRPGLVLADEPTGNLDSRNSSEVLALIREVCRENGAALLLVSHDHAVLADFGAVRSFASVNRAGGAKA